MKNALNYYRKQLDEIREAGTFKAERVITTPQRARIDTTKAHGVINMCANNYLGLADNPQIIEAAKASYDRWGFGLSSVRFICGTQELHVQLERKIADFVSQLLASQQPARIHGRNPENLLHCGSAEWRTVHAHQYAVYNGRTR